MLIHRDRFGKIRNDSLSGIVNVGVDSLPCLNRNNCIEIEQNNSLLSPSDKVLELSTSHRKSAFSLSQNVEHFCLKYGIEKIGFLTLTFRDHVLDYRESQKRFRSLRTNVLDSRYLGYIRVLERQKSGRIHYHLLVALSLDIRTGFDFSGISEGNYSSANSSIRAEWSFWRRTAHKYGFGRTELLPIKSTSEGIGKYVGKYIGKAIDNRLPEDKGCRLVEYSRNSRVASTKFQFVSSGSLEWRKKLRAFAFYISENMGCQPTFEGLRNTLGPRWAYEWRAFILDFPC
jgi:hypothetical protein